MTISLPYRQYICLVCGHIYDEAAGDPDAGIPPCTLWGDVPDTWICADCGVGKADFTLVER